MGQVPPLSAWKGTNAQTLRKESSAHDGDDEKLVDSLGVVCCHLTHGLSVLTVVSLNVFPRTCLLEKILNCTG